ncbi:MAG TPA: tetratricopeptide repeat protein [Roseiflexaceae bacterium]
MQQFSAIPLLGGSTIALSLKVGVATGDARRFVVGDPAIQRLDVLAGTTVVRMAAGEDLAQPGEVLLDAPTVAALGDAVQLVGWRHNAATGDRFAVLGELTITVASHPWPALPDAPLPAVTLRPWLLPAVFQREQAGLGVFLTEFRPVVALFLRFSGIDYEQQIAATALDTFIRDVQAVLVRGEGTLLQLTIGDKGSYLYAAFGAPIAHEDDARRAVLAALEIQRVAAELGTLDPVQIGISRGTMRCGAYGGASRRTYGVLGDDVNLAARLMGLAAPGQILVSGRVYGAVADTVAAELLPPIALKGKAELLTVFAISAARPRRAIRLEEPSYALPMVGRQAELAQIVTRLDQALTGAGQVVGIIGEAGMGKSRLLAEVIRLARRRQCVGYGGACRPDGITTPYLAWGEIWQALFDVDPTAPLRRQIRALEGALADLAPERIEALPLLGPLLGLNLPENDFTRTLEPQHRLAVLHALLLECLRTAAREAQVDSAGLLLVLEDLHWIDAASHDLLEEVARAIADLPVLLMLAYRPPELARLQAVRVEALPHFTGIHLTELSATEAEQAIRAKLAQLFPERGGRLPAGLVARLTAKAQGNPFYLEELLNYLHDRGIDPREEAALHALELPTNLHALILSRIDQLSARQQITLKVASVLGRRFAVATLHGAYPVLGALEELKADLEELAKLELTPLDTPEPELAYLFKHIVTQEVAYENLAYATRAALHGQVAAYLEAQDAERHLDLLAFHYARSDNVPKTRAYLRRAGEAAAARFANDAAVDYLSQALDVTPPADVAERYALLLAREQVYDRLGARDVQLQDLDALALAAGALGGDRRRAAILARRANYARWMGDYPAAVAAADQAVAQATAAAVLDVVVQAQLTWVSVLGRQGDYAAAQAHAEAIVQIARAIGDRSGECAALNDLGWAVGEQGDYAAARAYLDQSLQIARAISDRSGENQVLNALGWSAAVHGDYAAARAYLDQSLQIARTLGDRRSESVRLDNLGWVAVEQGDYATARAYLDQSLQIARTLGDRDLEATILLDLGFALLDSGQVAAAAAFQDALDIRHTLGQLHRVPALGAGLARVGLAQGDLAGALAHVEAILAYQAAGGALARDDYPLRVALICVQVLQAAGDVRATGVLAAAHATLQEQAARMPDEAVRRMFLYNVPWHRAIVTAWAAGQGKPTVDTRQLDPPPAAP